MPKGTKATLGDYLWSLSDKNVAVTAGANAASITFVRVIQRPDSRGGYNVDFAVPGSSLARYHVHFRRGGLRVNVVRYKPDSNGEGTNVMTVRDGHQAASFADLAHLCSSRYPNHALLFRALKAAVANRERLPNGELA